MLEELLEMQPRTEVSQVQIEHADRCISSAEGRNPRDTRSVAVACIVPAGTDKRLVVFWTERNLREFWVA